jgi:hypothetical protein
MALEPSDVQTILTSIALLNEQMTSLRRTVERSVDDHEGRIRNLEADMSENEKGLATIRERMTIFNMMQGTLTALASTATYWLAKR